MIRLRGGIQEGRNIETLRDGIGGIPRSPQDAKTENFNHIPGGCNVLYMDGHVEFLKYQGTGGKFPVVTYAAPYNAKIQGWSSHMAEGVQ